MPVPSTLPKVYSTLSAIALLSSGVAAQDRNGIIQPVPFSHRVHAGAARMACAACHVETGPRGERMSIAPVATCRSCHRTGASFARRKTIAWEPVWFLPDFVHFSHRVHARSTGCQTCHGPVEQRDILWREVETNMKFCRNCHKQTGAKAVCGTCHALR